MSGSTAASRFAGERRLLLLAGLLGLAACVCAAAIPASCAAETIPGSLVPFQAEPDRVLVLYNGDWTRDVEGSDPGQDSREVAEHYVRMHTDPQTGKRPHLLGLRCVHGKKHFNHWVIEEQSQDNKDGIVFVGEGPGPGPGEWVRDSRKVEVVIEPGEKGIDWGTVSFQCRPKDGGEWAEVTPSVTGAPVKKGRHITYPEVDPGRGRCYRFDAHARFPGTVAVRVRAQDSSGGQARDLIFTCYDRDDFRFSERGPDGVADDLHFQEDVVSPVKRFLENPKNALSDGTRLKEHVLYIVVCHGLPYACEGVFGIEHGVTARPQDHGDLASLENRLQTLYYGWGFPIRPPVVSMYMSGGPEAKQGVRNHRITTAMRGVLAGRKWNPYMHPDSYGFLAGREPPRSFYPSPLPVFRRQLPSYLFAYGVSRLDGEGPAEAKRQVDYAAYASRHLRPEMDLRVRQGRPSGTESVDLGSRLEEAVEKDLWGAKELEALGFPSPRRRTGLPFMERPPEEGRGSKESGKPWERGYYPGGMDQSVASSNGWNMGRHVGIWRQVDRGVTVSACGGPAYGGGPHITNTTFWDNRILMRYLFRGRDLGECFLRSTVHVNWSTSLLGDPLYHPDLRHTVPDATPPTAASREEVEIRLVPAMNGFAGILRVEVASTRAQPEVAELTVTCTKEGSSEEKVSRSHLYSSRPGVVLRDLDPKSRYTLRPVLLDPYGNRTDLSEALGPWSITTESLPDRKRIVEHGVRQDEKWRIGVRRGTRFEESGRMSVAFEAGRGGMIPSLRSEGLSFQAQPWSGGKRIRGRLLMGEYKRDFYFASPLEEGESAVMELRWRRFPLTRELLLTTPEGRVFSVVSDVRTPWRPFAFRTPLWIFGREGTRVSSAFVESDAQPASEFAR